MHCCSEIIWEKSVVAELLTFVFTKMRDGRQRGRKGECERRERKREIPLHWLQLELCN